MIFLICCLQRQSSLRHVSIVTHDVIVNILIKHSNSKQRIVQAMFYKGVVRKVGGKEYERESRKSEVLGAKPYVPVNAVLLQCCICVGTW